MVFFEFFLTNFSGPLPIIKKHRFVIDVLLMKSIQYSNPFSFDIRPAYIINLSLPKIYFSVKLYIHLLFKIYY